MHQRFNPAGTVVQSAGARSLIAHSPFAWDKLLKPHQRVSAFFAEVSAAAPSAHRGPATAFGRRPGLSPADKAAMVRALLALHSLLYQAFLLHVL